MVLLKRLLEETTGSMNDNIRGLGLNCAGINERMRLGESIQLSGLLPHPSNHDPIATHFTDMKNSVNAATSLTALIRTDITEAARSFLYER